MAEGEKTASWKTFTKHIRHFQASEDVAEVKWSVHALCEGNPCLTADLRTPWHTAMKAAQAVSVSQSGLGELRNLLHRLYC